MIGPMEEASNHAAMKENVETSVPDHMIGPLHLLAASEGPM